jgi:hypothetical protein
LYGDRWDCDQGYYKSGNQCIEVKVPENAHINTLYGDRWDCDQGYYKSGNQCIEVGVN